MSNFGIAIQIGLFKTAEYSYLGHMPTNHNNTMECQFINTDGGIL